MSKKKIIKTTIICVVFAALIAGLIVMMVLPQNYGNPDKLEIANSSFGKRMLIGLQVALLGIGTVFVMLILLIFVVTLMRKAFEGIGKMKEKQSVNKSVQTTKQEVAVANASCDEDEEVVAVIMAALNAYYETQNVEYKSNLKFRVRSIKEI